MSIANDIYQKIVEKDPDQKEFHQAVMEVLKYIELTAAKHPEYAKYKIYERIVEPDRTIIFRVPWLDDNGEIRINRGFRVQFNNAIGPYKGGLRFHPTVNLAITKFLGFEQTLKNSLTSLPMGGAKGGSDFDPKGKSDMEVMRFCQAFMRELFRHIGPECDVPAGDIGVGGREIGYLYGYYKKIRNEHTGVLTGKGLDYGGSLIRTEATGYGSIYFACEMLATRRKELKGTRSAVSGAGNVAQYTIEKINQLGGTAITISDSNGVIVDEEGIDSKKMVYVKELKNIRRGRIFEYAERYKNAKYFLGKSVWDVITQQGLKVDLAFPSATHNEIDFNNANGLIKAGCYLVSEGANMPSTPEAQEVFLDKNILYGPGKAANAGGVATSGLEMSQNSMHLSWDRAEVDRQLLGIMKSIHKSALDAAAEYGQPGNYLMGANIAGFTKVANAMVACGII
jgi:glutamate dehydrogenase (NADP+)